ncbi:MAG: hypothetical protein ACD_81C00189G0003 [uncultured bacterium]|nr:MAG: hypothetical protein ACD_81C00189G0003 [uncultured bacterium]
MQNLTIKDALHFVYRFWFLLLIGGPMFFWDFISGYFSAITQS